MNSNNTTFDEHTHTHTYTHTHTHTHTLYPCLITVGQKTVKGKKSRRKNRHLQNKNRLNKFMLQKEKVKY